MLPPGSWFPSNHHAKRLGCLSGQNSWTLLQQVYEGIQKAYSDLQVIVANTIADQFAFLGADVQSYIRTAVKALINYGLASVGLPPTLPNFEQLAEQGLDYCVQVALNEAAQTAGVSIEELPESVRQSITDEMEYQLSRLAQQRQANPFDVDYLKPAEMAQYRPAYVDVKVFNDQSAWSPPGTMTVTYYPVGKEHFSLFKYVSVPVPPLRPHDSTFIRVYLKPDHTDLPVYNEYYNGEIGECLFRTTVIYDVPDIADVAEAQDITGSTPGRPVVYTFDRDSVFEFSAISPPSSPLYD